MAELGIAADVIAKTLATVLAHGFWRTHVDKNDVEFVLAPATRRTSPTTPTPTFKIPRTEQELVVWMLDYDCVRDMAQDSSGVKQAVLAFYRNDPYFPRPFGHEDEDVRLWGVFKARFLDESRGILGDGVELAQEWVGGVEDEGARRKALGGESVGP
jgi:hypothetical protein